MGKLFPTAAVPLPSLRGADVLQLPGFVETPFEPVLASHRPGRRVNNDLSLFQFGYCFFIGFFVLCFVLLTKNRNCSWGNRNAGKNESPSHLFCSFPPLLPRSQ